MSTKPKQETKWPEHEKLEKISDKSQVVGDFLSWLAEEKRVVLGHYPMLALDCDCGWAKLRPQIGCPKCNGKGTVLDASGEPVLEESETLQIFMDKRLEVLLAEFFKIDQNKIEKEKRAMLSTMRKANSG